MWRQLASRAAGEELDGAGLGPASCTPRQPTRSDADLDAMFSSDTEDEETALRKIGTRIRQAEVLKEEGNHLLKEKRTAEARAAYKRALSEIWAMYRQPGGKGGDAVPLGAAIDLNLSLCHLRLEAWEDAKHCASRALAAAPGSAKGHYRRGVACARLGLLDAAEDDLKAAVRAGAGADAERELSDVRAVLAAVKKADQRGVARGFLCSGASQDGDGCTDDGEPAAEEEGDEPPDRPVASAEEVHATLGEVNGYLEAVGGHSILCRTAAERRALLEQLQLTENFLAAARAAVQQAAVGAPGPEAMLTATVIDVDALFAQAAPKLATLRPGLVLRERSPGELGHLRVSRELSAQVSGTPKARGFDLELVRWSRDAGPPTEDSFAELLFPPSGKPPDKQAAAWQREAFHRVFQQGASKLCAPAAWILLRELLALGAELRFGGQQVLAVGLAHGFFFASPAAAGPEEAPAGRLPKGSGRCSARPGSREDALAIVGGEDRRLVMLHSFTSLGIGHKWLLLRLAPAGADADDPLGELAVDLCSSALGLFGEPRLSDVVASPLVHTWSPAQDPRYIPRRTRWGDLAAPLAAPTHGLELLHGALEILAASCPADIAMAQLVGAAERCVIAARGEGRLDGDGEADASGRLMAGQRLASAVKRLGLQQVVGTDLLQPLCSAEAQADETLEAVRKVAAEELAKRKLGEAGLGNLLKGGKGAVLGELD